MTELRMTPKRLELLQAIADGKVTHYTPIGNSADYDRLHGAGRVTAAVETFRKAGLAELGQRTGPSYFAPRRWELTPSGESVLASHREVTG